MQNFEQQNADKRVLLGNTIQAELAKMYNESIEDFIKQHADDFRKAIDEHPELIEAFENDKETTLREIGKIVYH